MTTAFGLRCGMRAAAVAGGLPRGAVLCLLAGLLAGCGGGGAIAPVHSPAEPAIPGSAREYLVGRGDTLYSIAWRLGVDYRVLAGVNSIREPFTIVPGQRLLIPEPGDAVPADPEPPAGPASAVPPAAQAPDSSPAPAAQGSVAQGDVSIRATGAPPAPVITPLSPPKPQPIPSPMPQPATPPPVKAAAEAARPPQPPPKPAAAPPPLKARTVAGVSWTRPTQGKTIGGFGRGGNKGLDIGGTFEQPVRAAARGRVVYAGSGLVGYGKLVIVKHNNRLLSAYAHNERLHVGEGDEVAGGQRIADMGRSSKGRAMLHFEIRRNGKPVDPVRYLP